MYLFTYLHSGHFFRILSLHKFKEIKVCLTSLLKQYRTLQFTSHTTRVYLRVVYCISVFHLLTRIFWVADSDSHQPVYLWRGIYIYCTALPRTEFFIEPPPDTQRKRRRGEREIGVTRGSYLLLTGLSPPSPPSSPTPRAY